MIAHLPPLRLTGALSLRDGQMQSRSVALAAGRFTSGPLPAVDMTGFYLLPGIVDLRSCSRPRVTNNTTRSLAALDREAASHGVTTRFLSLRWSWENAHTAPASTTALARDWAAARGDALTDLRLQLSCERLMVAHEAALLNLVRACNVDHVVFTDRADTARDLRRTDPDGFAELAWGWGRRAEDFSIALDTVLHDELRVPRHLCRLAEAFDGLGVTYGSSGDRSAERREHYSMIGAHLCLDPGTVRVAAAAKAVGDPVLASAGDILADASRACPPPRIAALIQAGLCDGLVSGRDTGCLAPAVFRLVEMGMLPLEKAWRLVSEVPAAIMRLPDRGRIEVGKRADLTIVNAATHAVEATISAGRMSYLTGEAAGRFLGVDAIARLAAE